MRKILSALVVIAGLLGAQSPLGTRLAEEEVVAGAIDGVNATFGLAHAPYPWASLKLYWNGLRLTRCRDGKTTDCDYTLVAPYTKLTLAEGLVPEPGDQLVADYRW